MGSLKKYELFNIIGDKKLASPNNHQETDPRTEEPLWDCPIASTQDLEDAIAAANKAFPAWSKTTVAESQALLVKMTDITTGKCP
jgi:acyl-CoA reductase-like NAD-dependent aldehyde dehydrogenase